MADENETLAEENETLTEETETLSEEYESLLTALEECSVPFAENGWATRPESDYGVVQLDFEAGALVGDNRKQARSWQGSVDLFIHKKADRAGLIAEVEGILEDTFECAWYMNSSTYETETGLFHIEWVFETEC